MFTGGIVGRPYRTDSTAAMGTATASTANTEVLMSVQSEKAGATPKTSR
jgi:hypothetical protein